MPALQSRQGRRFHDTVLFGLANPRRNCLSRTKLIDPEVRNAYPTDYPATPSTRTHHIPRTSPNLPTGELPQLNPIRTPQRPILVHIAQAISESLPESRIFVLTAKGVEYQLAAILEEIGTELAAGAGEIV